MMRQNQNATPAMNDMNVSTYMFVYPTTRFVKRGRKLSGGIIIG